jgi:hypothetical protein
VILKHPRGVAVEARAGEAEGDRPHLLDDGQRLFAPAGLAERVGEEGARAVDGRDALPGIRLAVGRPGERRRESLARVRGGPREVLLLGVGVGEDDADVVEFGVDARLPGEVLGERALGLGQEVGRRRLLRDDGARLLAERFGGVGRRGEEAAHRVERGRALAGDGVEEPGVVEVWSGERRACGERGGVALGELALLGEDVLPQQLVEGDSLRLELLELAPRVRGGLLVKRLHGLGVGVGGLRRALGAVARSGPGLVGLLRRGRLRRGGGRRGPRREQGDADVEGECEREDSSHSDYLREDYC